MQSSDSHDPRNRYVIDIESGAETARLIDQDYLLTKAMGGIFPEQPDLTNIARILDIACGPGGWTTEVAFHYPDIEVVGVDINETVVKYARALAKVQQLKNVQFEIMDVKQGLKFPDESFDLVNGRLLFGFMDKASWPALLKECYRVLSPGGIVRITEVETEVSNSLAMQRLGSTFLQSLSKQGRIFSLDGRSAGMAHVFKKLLQDAGFEQIERRPVLIDASFDSEFHYGYCKDLEIAYALLKPYLIRAGLVNEAEFDELYNQMLVDMHSNDFLYVTFWVTAWGKKPE
jgi:ubiquinone/menaquinone biosynthesis C-methylase UbiE